MKQMSRPPVVNILPALHSSGRRNWVVPGDCYPRAPTDPDVPDYRIRFPRGSSRVEMLPSALPNTSASTHIIVSGLNHAAHLLPVYASHPGSPRRHARLGSGWWPALAGRDWLPAWFRRPVSASYPCSASPFPGLRLAHRKSISHLARLR